jgi:hypothetical protein
MLYAYVRQKPQDSFFVVQILALREKYFFLESIFSGQKYSGKNIRPVFGKSLNFPRFVVFPALFYKFGITFKDFHRRTANEIFNLKQLA